VGTGQPLAAFIRMVEPAELEIVRTLSVPGDSNTPPDRRGGVALKAAGSFGSGYAVTFDRSPHLR
jgi:hypothetical protein